MTEELIKQNAENYANKFVVRDYHEDIWLDLYDAHIAGAHSCDEEIEKLKKALSSAQKAMAELAEMARNPWISVENRLPDIGQKVITITNKGKLLLVARTTQPPHKEKGGWRWEHYVGKVTHWMPIPELKKGE